MKIKLRHVFTTARALLILAIVTMSSAVQAAPYPAPGIVAAIAGPDVDQNGYFDVLGRTSISLEVYDGLSAASGSFGFRFGFYYRDDPGTLIPIFDPADQGPPNQVALVDFVNGLILDANEPVASPSFVQAIFAPKSEPIGFFVQAPGAATALYSDPSLNAGFDVFGAHEVLTAPDAYFLSFPNFAAPAGLPNYLAVMTGIAPVPLPPAVIMLLSALGLLVTRHRSHR